MKAKTYYDSRPGKTKVVEAPDGCIAYFRENIESCEAPGEEGGTAYRCDEYSLFMRCSATLARARISANSALWLEKAKAEEARREAEEEAASGEPVADLLMEMAADHEERICMLELLGEEV